MTREELEQRLSDYIAGTRNAYCSYPTIARGVVDLLEAEIPGLLAILNGNSVVVPREPTLAMMRAGAHWSIPIAVHLMGREDCNLAKAAGRYKAMIAAQNDLPDTTMGRAMATAKDSEGKP